MFHGENMNSALLSTYTGKKHFGTKRSWEFNLAAASRWYIGLQIILWFVFLYVTVPDISRADFLWGMWHRAHYIEEGRWGLVFVSIFELFGGHIVAYTRIAQILNYILADYSGTVVRWAAILTYVAAISSFVWLTQRHFPNSGRLILLLAGVILICSPVPADVIAWAEPVILYFSCFIVLCLSLPYICRTLAATRRSGWRAWALLVALVFAIVIGSGVGWAILPLLPLAWLLSRGFIDDLSQSPHNIKWLGIGTASMVLVALVSREGVLTFMSAYEQRFWLDDARRSLELIFVNPWLPLRYFFALLATNLTTGTIAMM